MKGKIFWLVVVICLIGFLLSGCGGTSFDGSPLLPPASETPETETGKTAKLILRFNFGNSEKRRWGAYNDLIPFIVEAQAKKVDWISGHLENTATGAYTSIYQNLDDGDEIELMLEPGEYDLWLNACTSFDTAFGEYTFCLFEGKKRIVLEPGENPENVTLTLSEFQPVIITLPESTQASIEVKGRRQFTDWEEKFSSFFPPLVDQTKIVGTIPLNATEIKVYFQDKIYSVSPGKIINSLTFDEPIILGECPFVTAAIAVINVDIPDNKVVAGTTELIALKFKVKALADVDINDVIRIAKYGDSEYDIDETTLTAIDCNGDECHMIYTRTSPITHGHAHFYFFSTPLNIPEGDEIRFIFSVNVSPTAQPGNKFSFGIGVINANSNEYEVKEIGPEFTVVSNGIFTIGNDSNPASHIVLAGSANNVFANIKFSAKSEQIRISEMTIAVENGDYCGIEGEYRDVSSISVYDGSLLLGQMAVPAVGYCVLNFPPKELIIPSGESKIITIKADMATVDPDFDNAPGTNSAAVKIDLYDIKAIGTTSNFLFYFANPVVESNPMILKTSRPIVEYSTPWDSMGAATAPTNGNINLFNFRVTADASGGDVLLNKISLRFQHSDPNIRIKSVLIKNQDGDILNYGYPSNIYEGDCEFPLNNPDFVVEGEESIRIPSGQSRTFYVWATVSKAGLGDSITITLLGDNTCSPVGTAAEVASQNNFVWSDNYRQIELIDAPKYSQWYNGHLVPGLLEPEPYTISTP